ncbi:MAG: NADH-quinone oxidoreductase subunit L [Gammaproteobacteria bacterium]|nr:NADH-quinone oxidoreductase subunit L [Gammaproteobacteria bacterium]
MQQSIWLVPLFPLLSSVLLMVTAGSMPRRLVAILGAGSVGLSALFVLLAGLQFMQSATPYSLTLWTWMQVGNFAPQFSFYIDQLTLVMMSVITGVGFLIHLYSTEFMEDDAEYSRYFAYMNMFVAAMLILVMADNLLLLYLGWEGVGVCSYLLVGFWYKDPANGAASRKAFVVTRIGDTAMALGLFLLFTELGTLEIQPMLAAADARWISGDTVPAVAALLLLGGAVGKSAQLPLHTWLPDAMAGPTPVSALIHAATMVTAGVYLIARTHGLFLLAPDVLLLVALVGLVTLLLAAFTALNQHDIKRILAYSTISQIGYMFMALGVGAWSAGIFHLMTHAFFKALLFLAAGAVIHCLHHEHDIFKMGGLRKKLPVTFWSFVIGSAALAALPFTSGFFSKDQILLSAFELHGAVPGIGPWLWAGGILGALLTAIYSFRLVFIVFFGKAKTEPDRQLGWRMAGPLSLLCVLSLIGGLFVLPLENVFPPASAHQVSHLVEGISIGTPLVGLLIAWLVYYRGSLPVSRFTETPGGSALRRFWHSGWAIDKLYDTILVRPFVGISTAMSGELLDRIYHGIVQACQSMHGWLSRTQTGKMRWYATSMVFGLIALVTLLGWVV